jgi:hypothetical protein
VTNLRSRCREVGPFYVYSEEVGDQSLHGGFGNSYAGEEEEVFDSNPPGTLEFVNSVGLVASGSRAPYKRM